MQQDLMPTLLYVAVIETDIAFDGRSLVPMMAGQVASFQSEFYITECTWMRKHGWRTPEWKLTVALDPDFHFKPAVELLNLIEDPLETNNLAKPSPHIVALLKSKMQSCLANSVHQDC